MGHPSETEHRTALFVAVLVAAGFIAIALPQGGQGSVVRAVCTAVLWTAIILGLAFGAWPRTAIPRPALVTGTALGALALLTGASMLWGSDDGRTFQELIRVLSYMGLFLVVVLATRHGSARTWLHGLGIGLVAVSLIALFSRLLPGLFPPAEIQLQRPDTLARLAYPLNYWNGDGMVAAGAILLMGWLSAAAETRWVRALAAATLPLLALTLFFTSSRGSMAALGVGVVVLLAADRRRGVVAAGLGLGLLTTLISIGFVLGSPALLNGLVLTEPGLSQAHIAFVVALAAALAAGVLRRFLDHGLASLSRRKAPPWVRPVALGAGAVLIILLLLFANPLQRIEQFTAPPAVDTSNVEISSHLFNDSGSGRYQFWSAAFEAFESAPLTGIGAGGFQGWWGAHGTLPLYVENAHSLPLETLGDLGAPGFLLILMMLITPLVAGFRRLRDEIRDPALAPALALLATGILACSIDWVWELPAAFVPAMLAAALLAGPALSPAPESGRGRFGFGVLVILIGWVAILASASSLFTEYKIQQSRDAFDVSDFPKAILYARQARALQPWAAAPRFQEMFAQERAGDIPAALAAADQAIARAPTDWALWHSKARLLVAADDLPGALAAGFASVYLRADERLAPAPALPEDLGLAP